MDDPDSYTTAEIVRALNRIEGKLDGLGAHFVPRELHEQQLGEIDHRVADLGVRVMDLEADGARTRRELAEVRQESVPRATARWWVMAVVAAIPAVAAITALLAHAA